MRERRPQQVSYHDNTLLNLEIIAKVCERVFAGEYTVYVAVHECVFVCGYVCVCVPGSLRS